MIFAVIVVGLLAHGGSPQTVPQLEGVAQVAVAVNADVGPEPTPWLGFGANHNRLMREHSDADWYVALNSDVDLSAQQLHTLIDQADADGYSLAAPLRREPWGVQGSPGAPLPTPGYFWRSTVRIGRPIRRRLSEKQPSKAMVETTWIGGCCMAIRGDLMRELSFDERFFMYFEDVDLCQRGRDLGARVGVCTTVTIDHATGWRRKDPLIARRGVEYARSALLYAKAHGYSPRIMRAAVLTWASSRAVMPGRGASARAASKAIARGMASPALPGLAELASAHNKRYEFSAPTGT
jgi:N-acetylglucosaminyl-diphospho-decaprenol L-rhamnosyltransferase